MGAPGFSPRAGRAFFCCPQAGRALPENLECLTSCLWYVSWLRQKLFFQVFTLGVHEIKRGQHASVASFGTAFSRRSFMGRSARIHVLMRKRILASPPPQCWLLTHFARPRRVRMVFGAKGERVRVSAASPLVLVVMRRRAAELQICDAGAEPGGTRCSMRASEPCAMCDSWQIMSMWNTRCAQSEQWVSHVSTTTRLWPSERL